MIGQGKAVSLFLKSVRKNAKKNATQVSSHEYALLTPMLLMASNITALPSHIKLTVTLTRSLFLRSFPQILEEKRDCS